MITSSGTGKSGAAALNILPKPVEYAIRQVINYTRLIIYSSGYVKQLAQEIRNSSRDVSNVKI